MSDCNVIPDKPEDNNMRSDQNYKNKHYYLNRVLYC